MFYSKTNFRFSKFANKWILDRFRNRFDSTFFHDLDVSQYDAGVQDAWAKSLPGQELTTFLSPMGLNIDHMGICVFISNLDSWYPGNPHIDMKFGSSGVEPVNSRFNVLILGNPLDEYIWWNDVGYDHPELDTQTFTAINGIEYKSKCVPGSDISERYRFLGNPSLRTKNVLTPSAFVKTNCAHTVHVTPGPRLIVTVGFKETLNEIVEKNNL